MSHDGAMRAISTLQYKKEKLHPSKPPGPPQPQGFGAILGDAASRAAAGVAAASAKLGGAASASSSGPSRRQSEIALQDEGYIYWRLVEPVREEEGRAKGRRGSQLAKGRAQLTSARKVRFDNPAQLAVLSSSSGGSGLGGGRSSSNGAAGATEVGHPFVPALSVVIGGAARRRVGVGLPPAPDDALPSPTFSAIKLQPAVLSLSKRRSATGGCCSISGDGSCSPGTPPPAQPAAALGSGGHQQESNRDAPAGAAAAPQHPSTSSDGGRATGQQPRLQARWLDDLGGSGEGAESPPSSSSAAAPNLADKELSRLRAAMHKPAAPQEPDSPGGGFRPLATIPAELFARWSSGAGGEAAGAGPSASGGGSGASSTAGPSSQHGAADGPSGKAGGGVGGGSSSGSGLLVGGRKSTDARRSIEGRRSAQQSASGGGGRGAAAPTSLLAAASASPAGGWRELHGQGSASRVGGVNNSVSGSSGGGGVRGGSGSGVGRQGGDEGDR